MAKKSTSKKSTLKLPKKIAGVAVPKERPGRLAYISEFLDGIKRDGSLQRIVADAQLRGLEVVPANK